MAIVKRTPRPGELTRGAKHSRFLVFDQDGRPVASSSKASDFAKWPSNPHEGDTIVYGENGPEWTSDETPFNPNGTYPNLTAGKANEASYISSDREIDDTSGACPPSTFGPTGGTAEVASGYVALTEILGNTVVDDGDLVHAKSKYIKSTGRNQWNEQWEKGAYDTSTGSKVTANHVRSKDFIRVIPGEKYFGLIGSGNLWILQYDKDKTYLGIYTYTANTTITLNASCYYVTFYTYDYGNTYNNDICIYINYDTPNLPYTPYWEDVIELPNIEGKSAGSGENVIRDVLYQEGGGKQNVIEKDIGSFSPGAITMGNNGTNDYFLVDTVNKKAGYYNITCSVFETVSDLDPNGTSVEAGKVSGGGSTPYLFFGVETGTYADVNDFLSAMSGKTITYALATPIDIVSDGWTEKLRVDNFGTLQFLDEDENEVAVAQAYNIYYTVNLVEYLDSAYVYTDGDPSKLMLKSDNVIPAAPTTDGTYVLTVTVADGTATYTWESGS